MKDLDLESCPFCAVPDAEIVMSNGLCYARWDKFPVSDGHILVIPVRHFSDYFQLSAEERVAVWELVSELQIILADRYSPAGYNVGVNVGEAAGQSVAHLHIHVIPRYAGDIADPYGGIRGVLVETKTS